jgi:DNA-binding beta-propeller fold protein YncE
MKSSRIVLTGLAAALVVYSASAGAPFTSPLSAQQQHKEIPFDSAGDFLKLPEDVHFGEVAGVATMSNGNIWVYHRGGGPNATIGASRTYINGGARLFEFDKSGKFLREIGTGPVGRPYSFLFAQGVRVDPQNNVWTVDRASRMVVKFDSSARVLMTLGRRPEAIGEVGSSAGSGVFGRGTGPAGSGVPGDNFNQPLDVAWDAQGNIFVVDGYTNARVAKFDKTGRFDKSWGHTGSEPGQFNTPHSIAVDAQGNVYVADMGNNRIQVFDNNGTFKTQFTNVGTPRAICISPGAQQFLYASNSNPTEDPFLNGEIYKMQLDGTIVGRIGRAGKNMKEFGMVNAIDCREPNTLYVAELMNWRVQKLTLK